MTRDPVLGRALLTIARSAIAIRLGFRGAPEPQHDALRRPGATFVTLRWYGELRGCIGTIRPVRLLADDVRDNALAAAFHDTRFAPLAARELEATSIEVSLLSADEPLPVMDEAELAGVLRPRVDGVVLEYAHHRATLLPQVWETISDPREFIAALKSKAGLSAHFWSPQIRISRYGVEKWEEDASRREAESAKA